MRIGIDATALPPQPVGAGNYMIQLIRALAGLETGHHFTVFAHPHGRALIDQPSLLGIEWSIVAEKGPAQRLAWEQTAFPALIRDARVDLLHSLHYTRPLVLPCPSVVTFHDMTFFLFPELHTRLKRLFFPNAIRFSARAANALIAVSESTRRDAIRLLKLPPEKIWTVPLGVTPDYHPVRDPVLLGSTRQKYHLPDRFLLFVGTVEPRKNLPLLLRVYRRLVDTGLEIPLVIVGRLGWMYDQVFALIETLGLKERIHFAGYLPDQDLPMIYNLAELLVYPSIYEGFGLPPLEALACGTPVITTAVSSLPEHVGEGGLLVPPGDEQALFQALQQTITDPQLRQELARRGPPQAAQFTWKRTAQATLQVYQRVLQTS
jgi:glycosyltransferase involved in cell wall biosynthesis